MLIQTRTVYPVEGVDLNSFVLYVNDANVNDAGEVSTRGCGRFEMYASQEPESCLLDGDPLNFAYDAARSRLLLTLPRADKLLRTLQITF